MTDFMFVYNKRRTAETTPLHNDGFHVGGHTGAPARDAPYTMTDFISCNGLKRVGMSRTYDSFTHVTHLGAPPGQLCHVNYSQAAVVGSEKAKKKAPINGAFQHPREDLNL